MENSFRYSFNEKRYHTFNYYLKTRYNCKVAKVILDASQSLGIVNYNLSDGKYDYLIFAGHKNLYASFGVNPLTKLA